MLFIMNYTEYKGAKIEIFTSIKDHQNLLTFILDLGLAPETKFGSIWAIYFFSYYSPYKTAIQMDTRILELILY